MGQYICPPNEAIWESLFLHCRWLWPWLWHSDQKINRVHLLVMTKFPTKFGGTRPNHSPVMGRKLFFYIEGLLWAWNFDLVILKSIGASTGADQTPYQVWWTLVKAFTSYSSETIWSMDQPTKQYTLSSFIEVQYSTNFRLKTAIHRPMKDCIILLGNVTLMLIFLRYWQTLKFYAKVKTLK